MIRKKQDMIKPRVALGDYRSGKRLLIYAWVMPSSAFALPLVFLNHLAGGQSFRVSGVLEVKGPLVRWFLSRSIVSAAALTLGHVVLYADEEARQRFRSHELVHVLQAEMWGPLFLPTYLILALISWHRTGSGYWNHPWEVEAREKAGI